MAYSIEKGDVVFVPLLMINRSKAIWGVDAHEFRLINFSLGFCSRADFLL
jgi:cytochrome P450